MRQCCTLFFFSFLLMLHFNVYKIRLQEYPR